MSVAVGSPAPGFSLLDQGMNTVTLEGLRGRKSLIVFIPTPFTGICDGESCAVRDELATLNDLDANVVIITCHAVPIAKKWSDDNGFNFRVLSDFWPHGAVARAYGAFNEDLGVANRVTIVIDAAGTVRTVIDSGSLETPREFSEYLTALEKII
jgi:peroxiredoxin